MRPRSRSRRASKIRVIKSTLSQVLTPNNEAGERLMLEFPEVEGLAGLARRRARRPAVDPEPDRRNAARRPAGRSGSRNTRSASASTSPAEAICCSKPMPATRRSSGSRRWKIRSRPSFAATRASRSATSRPPADGCRSWSATRPRSMPRSSGCATLTQPVALTGNRDWDVQVVDSTRIVLTPDAERDRRRR